MKHISSNYSEALGLTLLHSLWQGVIVFVLFALGIYIFKTAATRYITGILALAVQLFVSVFTFLFFFDNTIFVVDEGYSIALNNVEIGTFMSFFMQNIDAISLIWLLGITLLFGRMSVGLLYIQSLRKDVSDSIQPELKSVFSFIKNALGITQKVPLLESSKVTVPLTLGWLKPIVLLSVGLASGIDIKQLEAILAHELAHVKRHDYIINILQSIIEIIFFYHPLIWVISNRVRTERENCCDDVALKLCGNDKLILAKALASVASFELQPQYAMAFGAKTHSLKNRIKRLLGYYPQKNFTIMNWLVTGLILTISISGYAYFKEEDIKPEKIALSSEKKQTVDVHNNSPYVSVVNKVNRAEPDKETFEIPKREIKIELPVEQKVRLQPMYIEKPKIIKLDFSKESKDSTFSIANYNVYTSDWKLRSLIKSLSGANKNPDIKINNGKLYVEGIEMPDSKYESLYNLLEEKYKKVAYFDDNNFVVQREKENVRVYFLNKDFKPDRLLNFIERRSRSLEVKDVQKKLKRANILNTKKDFVLSWNKDSSTVNGKVLSERKHRKILKVLNETGTYNSFENYPNGFKLEKKGIRTVLTSCDD